MATTSQFQLRRKQVFEQMADNSIALLPAAATQYRNNDTEYNFRQDSYFHYLTGFNESFAIAVLLKKQGATRFILFCQERDPQAERWTGERAGIQGACQVYGADEAYSITEAQLRFPELFSGVSTVYYVVNNNPAFDKKLFSWIQALQKKARAGVPVPHKFFDLRMILDEMRLIKTPEELSLIRQACDIAAKGHQKAMQACQVGMNEFELEAVLLYEFTRRGSRAPAYPCIVAGGNNACTLHYTRNNDLLKDQDLVLIDAGAEYECYASDITRTFPVNGKFTPQQKTIYELVLASQKAAIAKVAPGVTWDEMQKTILSVLVAGMIELKILKGDPQTLIEEKAYQPYYMHNSGHWLGLDVHDVGDYKQAGKWRKLALGMVFTIEPGLYFPQDAQQVAPEWRGIGVRIEDDILVTTNGCEVLTQAVPKSVEEIEKWMANK